MHAQHRQHAQHVLQKHLHVGAVGFAEGGSDSFFLFSTSSGTRLACLARRIRLASRNCTCALLSACGHCRVNAGMRWGVIANKRIRMFYYKTATSLHSTACFAVCKAVIASINLLVKLIATAQSIHTWQKKRL
jgi:hypothetical protein